MVERLAAERPLVLAVEDLHWADRSTLDLLAFLVANPAEAPVVLVATYRSDDLDRRHPLRPVLAELDRHPTVERLELGRLDHAQLEGLLAGILGTAPPPELLTSVLDRSDGNPFFAEELAVARSAGARQEEGWALMALGNALSGLGEREAGRARLRQAREVAEEVGDAELLADVFTFLPQVLDAAGRLADALAEVLEGMAAVGRLGLERSNGGFLAAYAANVCFRLGRWQDADQHGRKAVATARMPTMSAMHARNWLAQLEIERGEATSATQLLDEVERGFADHHTPQLAGFFAARAALAIWQSRLKDACAAVQQGLAGLADAEEEPYFRSLLTLGLRAEADRAERSRAHRQPAEADAAREVGTGLLARLRQLVDEASASEPETAAHAMLGEAEAGRLEGHADPERWAAAAAAWDQLAQPYPASYARWRQAEALLTQHGARAAATTALRQANEVTRWLGAAPLRGELERLARRARIDLAAHLTTSPHPHGQPTRTGSPHANARSSPWSPTAGPTPRSPRRCSSAQGPPASTSPTSWPSSASPAAARPPPSPTAPGSWTSLDRAPGNARRVNLQVRVWSSAVLVSSPGVGAPSAATPSTVMPLTCACGDDGTRTHDPLLAKQPAISGMLCSRNAAQRRARIAQLGCR